MLIHVTATLAAVAAASMGVLPIAPLTGARTAHAQNMQSNPAAASALGGSPASYYDTGAMYARLGQADSAFVWLNRAVARGFADGNLLQVDEDLASIRSDARFQQLLYAATHAPRPCGDAADRHRLDFWIGDWDVKTPGGAPAGKSSVQLVSGGCALLENWSDLRGGSGKSLNAFNPLVGQWQQYWIGQNGIPIEYRESEWSDGRVTYFTRAAATASSPASIGRLTFSRLDSVTVRQFSELSTDGGKTWKTQYDLRYHHRTP